MSSQETLPTLVDLIATETIRVHQTASDWEQATDLVGNLLVNAGTVDARYVDAMKEVLQEMGPYAVIAPGIVLLHARPEDGVKEPTFGLVTLKDPVPFGNTANDPVDLVFAFGATDKESHIHALKDLANILSQPNLLNRIRAAEKPDDILAILQEETQVEEPKP
jgi:mannitol/fructose-specific phosphotransferase system IIA component (Ntr-type)